MNFSSEVANTLIGQWTLKAFSVTNYLSSNREKVSIQVTGSFGVTAFNPENSSVEEVISLADKAMYTGSKKDGKNKVSTANII